MAWVKIGEDHECCPADWESRPHDSVYRCPTCGRVWAVRKPTTHSAWCEDADPGEALVAWLLSPPCVVAAALAVAVLIAMAVMS